MQIGAPALAALASQQQGNNQNSASESVCMMLWVVLFNLLSGFTGCRISDSASSARGLQLGLLGSALGSILGSVGLVSADVEVRWRQKLDFKAFMKQADQELSDQFPPIPHKCDTQFGHGFVASFQQQRYCGHGGGISSPPGQVADHSASSVDCYLRPTRKQQSFCVSRNSKHTPLYPLFSSPPF